MPSSFEPPVTSTLSNPDSRNKRAQMRSNPPGSNPLQHIQKRVSLALIYRPFATFTGGVLLVVALPVLGVNLGPLVSDLLSLAFGKKMFRNPLMSKS